MKISKRDKKFYLYLAVWIFSSLIMYTCFWLINPSIEGILALDSTLLIFIFVGIWRLANPKDEESNMD